MELCNVARRPDQCTTAVEQQQQLKYCIQQPKPDAASLPQSGATGRAQAPRAGRVSTLRCCIGDRSSSTRGDEARSGSSSTEFLYTHKTDFRQACLQPRAGAGARLADGVVTRAEASAGSSSRSSSAAGGTAGCGDGYRTLMSPVKDVLWHVGCICRNSNSTHTRSSGSQSSRSSCGDACPHGFDELTAKPDNSCSCQYDTLKQQQLQALHDRNEPALGKNLVTAQDNSAAHHDRWMQPKQQQRQQQQHRHHFQQQQQQQHLHRERLQVHQQKHCAPYHAKRLASAPAAATVAAATAADTLAACASSQLSTAIGQILVRQRASSAPQAGCCATAQYCAGKLSDRLSDYEDIWDTSSSDSDDKEDDDDAIARRAADNSPHNRPAASEASLSAARVAVPCQMPEAIALTQPNAGAGCSSATSGATTAQPPSEIRFTVARPPAFASVRTGSVDCCTPVDSDATQSQSGATAAAQAVVVAAAPAVGAPASLAAEHAMLPSPSCAHLLSRRGRVGSVPAVIVSKLTERAAPTRRLSLGVVRQSSTRRSLKSQSGAGVASASPWTSAQRGRIPHDLLRQDSLRTIQQQLQQQRQRCDFIRATRGSAAALSPGDGSAVEELRASAADVADASRPPDAGLQEGGHCWAAALSEDWTHSATTQDICRSPAELGLSRRLLTAGAAADLNAAASVVSPTERLEGLCRRARADETADMPSDRSGRSAVRESQDDRDHRSGNAYSLHSPSRATGRRGPARACSFQEREAVGRSNGMRQHNRRQRRKTLPQELAYQTLTVDRENCSRPSLRQQTAEQVQLDAATDRDPMASVSRETTLTYASPADLDECGRQATTTATCPKFPIHLDLCLARGRRRDRRFRQTCKNGGGDSSKCNSTASSSSGSCESLTLLDVVQAQSPEYSFEPISHLTSSNLSRLSTYDNLLPAAAPAAAAAAGLSAAGEASAGGCCGYRLSIASCGSTVFSKPWDVGPAEELLRSAAAAAAAAAVVGAAVAGAAAACADDERATPVPAARPRSDYRSRSSSSEATRSCSSPESFGIQMRSLTGDTDDGDERLSIARCSRDGESPATGRWDGEIAGEQACRRCADERRSVATGGRAALSAVQSAPTPCGARGNGLSRAAPAIAAAASAASTPEPLLALERFRDTLAIDSDRESARWKGRTFEAGEHHCIDCVLAKGVAPRGTDTRRDATGAGAPPSGLHVEADRAEFGALPSGGVVRLRSEEADSGTELDSSLDNVCLASVPTSPGVQLVRRPESEQSAMTFSLCRNSQASLLDFSLRVKQMRSPKLSKRRCAEEGSRATIRDMTAPVDALRQTDPGAQPSVIIREHLCHLAQSRRTMFGDAVHSFICCTQESTASNPRVLLSNVRQFMNGIKNFLINHGEPSLDRVLRDEMLKLNAGEFLNVDAVLEGALLKCVALPLKPVIYRAFVSYFNKNGSLKAVADGIRAARSKSLSELGLRGCFSPSQGLLLESIKSHFFKMQSTYSPIRKLESLLSACSKVYSVIGCSQAPGVEDMSGRHDDDDAGRSECIHAEDFPMMLAYVLIRCGAVNAEIEAEYMRGLLPPSLSCGEGAYYITALSSVVAIIKRMGTSTLSNQVLHGSRGSLESCVGFLKVYVPDESTSSIVSIIVPTCSSITVKEIGAMVAHRLFITNPQDYALCVVANGKESKLADNETLTSATAKWSGHSFVFKRSSAQIIWPSVLD